MKLIKRPLELPGALRFVTSQEYTKGLRNEAIPKTS
jgi:hypothetical protein